MQQSENNVTAVVVPTLGTRPEYLRECLNSIRAAGRCQLIVVTPAGTVLGEEPLRLVDAVIDDPGRGLAAAINAGIAAAPASVQFATWLGDDDRLTPRSLDVTRTQLQRTGAVLAFGRCRYIDREGKELWLNNSGNWAVPLMRFGPQLVPQPGSLFKVDAFNAIGALDESLKWAFDLDLFLRLGRAGRTTFIRATLAEFRWHEGSLSVGGRNGSVNEASSIRIRNLPRVLRPLSVLWEPLIRQIILFAGTKMSQRVERG